MPKLLVKQATVDYYGFFASPAFDLIGEGRTIMSGLAKTFAAHNVGLNNFRLEGEATDPSSAGILLRLPPFGIYRFKFDQVQAGLNGFTDEELEGMVSIIQKGNGWVRQNVSDFKFKSHAFVYASHCALSDRTSSEFLLAVPRRPFPVLGEDLGSGVLENWRDPDIDATVRFTL